jgi:hypothetical protein
MRLTRSTVRSVRLARSAAQPASLQQLEGRALMAVSLDASGFTVVTPALDSQVIYVSSSRGDDDNDGLSPATAVQTLDRGEALLRDGHPDQMLLARGDAWRESFGEWTKSGRSPAEPMLVGAYGAGARPRIETGSRSAFQITAYNANVRNLSLIGLHMVASARVPGSRDYEPSASGGNGLRILAQTDHLFVEDCVIQAYGDNVLFQEYRGASSNVTVRRCAIVDAYASDGGRSQGLYATGVDGLLLEGNLFDHNGWSEDVKGSPATIYNHNVYLSSDNSGVVVRGNVIANASSHGLQARSGGVIENNVFLDNPIGLTFGVVKGASVMAGGVTGSITGNIFLGTRDINGLDRGKALEMGNTTPGVQTLVANNIFAHANEEYGSDFAMLLSYAGDTSTNGEMAAGLNDVTLEDNIVYRWSKGLRFDPNFVPGGKGRFGLNRVTIRRNAFQKLNNAKMVYHESRLDPAHEKWEGNRYDAPPDDISQVFVEGQWITLNQWHPAYDPSGAVTAAPYADPERTADSYALANGLDSRFELLDEMKANSSQLWRPQFTATGIIDYIRAGFAEPAPPPAPLPPPAAPVAVATPPEAPAAGDAVVTFTITYGDDRAIDPSSLDAGDVRLVGRKGKVDVPASVVAVEGGGEGQPLVVTYAAPAPDGAWDRRERGEYALVVQDGQVTDTDGLAVPSGEVATFTMKVAPRPPADRTPMVTKTSFNRRWPESFTAWFSEDVGASITADDLVLRTEDGAVTIDPSQMTVSYDPVRRAATWTFSNLPTGRYRATLTATGITDSAGQQLDGNRDRTPGDDFTLRTLLRV